jgi:RNAse (barnase) inhibitor barstar
MKRKTPESLADLSANVVMPMGLLSGEQVRAWTQAAGHRYVEAALAGCRDRKAVLRAVGAALGLPSWFGANLDALYDSLMELADSLQGSGLTLMLSGLPVTPDFGPAEREALLDVLRDAAEAYAEQGVALRVLLG